MAIYLPELDPAQLWFPPVEQALEQPDGLLAMGGDLSVARLALAYQSGIFPWFSEGDPLLWWSPAIRAVFPPASLKFNRTLRKQWQRSALRLTVNHAFNEVVQGCAAPRNKQPETWILPPMQQAYQQLHQQGYAHSIEVWQADQLVGGLYGIVVGGLFCGESMFNRIPNGAKFALLALQQHLGNYSAGWIDCQIPNPFLQQLGATTIRRADYLSLLQQQAALTSPAGHWQPQVLSLAYD
ncbi:leucyl/phenylalanyl-tRNA--protein transferase [Arsukibacterium indicum]|uniref:Leucyl/phenylalanyl-tRNA--protein transferase n=1 Tax=Arsukibacterium indicum TaxID=2848612 RepID=A0ABS6MFC7_9GAMM|nr:leucyl/phenylalanyl-tRNA--protein transferase [Arsukibacterium indicum]MBV2127521.1 leucyl/phenylalanyl-tRNA--protein transferase [Arsukibacterium indicum]